MTPEEQLLEDRRRNRGNMNFRSGDMTEDVPQSVTRPDEPARSVVQPRTFQQMVGQGESVEIPGLGEFEIKPYPMRLLAKAGSMLAAAPGLYLAQAMLTEEEDQDSQKIADKLNMLFKRADGEDGHYTAVDVDREMMYVFQTVTEAAVESILDAILMSIRPARPELTAADEEQIKDSVDHPTMIAFIRQIFLLNSGLAKRF